MGFTDHLSKLTSGNDLPLSHYDNEFVVATINNISENFFAKMTCTKQKGKTNKLLLNYPVDAYRINI